MRTFKVISITVLTIFIILAIALNVVMIKQQNHTDGQYRVEVKRLADEIEEYIEELKKQNPPPESDDKKNDGQDGGNDYFRGFSRIA